jgi:hypothetical protein
MDTTYRDVLKQIILHYAAMRPSHGDIQLDAVFDETRDRYALMQAGWDRERRVSGDLLYVTLRDHKVYLEYDGIGYGITDDLVAGGIPEQDIVLAYLPDAPTLADYNRMDTQGKTRPFQAKSASGAAAHVGA